MSIICDNVAKLEEILNIGNELDDFPEELRGVLVSIIKKEGYKCCNITKRTVSTNGANFLGILHEVDVKGTTNKGSNQETYLFIKQAKVLKKIQVVSVDNIYGKEVFFYTNLVKVFENLQNEANIPENERFNTPKGYFESSKQAIILENLKRRGYKSFKRTDGLKLKRAELSIEQLAKFHGLSFVMQEKMPEYYEMEIKPLKFPLTFNDDWNVLIANVCDKIVDVLDDNVKDKVRKLLPKIQNEYHQYLNDNSQLCALCHGDYKAHNIMVKDADGECISVMPLDYQLIYYGCPVMDFMFYIFSSTDQQFRRQHLEHLKSIYHNSLSKFLKYFAMDVELIFPRYLFDQIYRERLLYGLMTGTIMSFFYFVPEDNVPDVENQALAEMTVKPAEGFVSWVRGLMDDFIQWGYL